MDNKFKGQRRIFCAINFVFAKHELSQATLFLEQQKKAELFLSLKEGKTFQQEKKRASCERNCFCHTFQDLEWNSLENQVKTFIKCFFLGFDDRRCSEASYLTKISIFERDPFSQNHRSFPILV